MLRLLALALTPLIAQTSDSVNDGLIHASKDPYQLARFIDTHLGFDWNVLWKALGTSGVFMQPCGKLSDGSRHCSTELITVLDPDQIIVLVMGDFTPLDAYIRFLKQKDGSWRFSGIQEAALHNHPRRHEVDRSAGTPFLRISHQGVRGSGIDSEEENWYDLTRGDFVPVFSLTVSGYEARIDGGISRKIQGVANLRTDNEIDASLLAEFSGFDGETERALGAASFSAIYKRRAPTEQFKIQSAGSLAPAEFESLADIGEDVPLEDLIRYDLPRLKEIAAGGERGIRSYLRRLLTKAKSTPEVRELRSVLP